MERLDIYEPKPAGMELYLRNYGWHFSKKMYEFAVSHMVDRAENPLSPVSIETVKEFLLSNGITIKSEGYDVCYVYTMCMADYYGSAIEDTDHLALFIKDYIDDKDGYDGIVFTRFYADCIATGKVILWEEMI